MKQLKDLPAYKDIIPLQMQHDTISEENTNLINELAETISQSSMGQTSVDELDELLKYDELDLTIAQVCDLVLGERENKSEEPQPDSENFTTKDLQNILLQFNNLEISLKEHFECNVELLEKTLDKLSLASMPIKEAMAKKHKHLFQSLITNSISRQSDAQLEAKNICKLFATIE